MSVAKANTTMTLRADPPLIGPDPVWKIILAGKGHVYYGCILILIFTLAVSMGAPRWLDILSAFCAGSVFACCWSHEFLH
jgi:hypothetical protein